MAEDIRIPSLGESVTEATIAKWLKAEGEAVEADEPVVELETDKVSMEVNAPVAGVLTEQLVKEGESVEVGALIGKIDPDAKAEKSAAKKETSSKASSSKAASSKAAPSRSSDDDDADDDDEASGELVDIIVPEAGESVTEAGLGGWLKAKGDAVKADEPIAELETDKAAMEVNAPVSGVLVELLAEEGATVHPGDVIGRIEKGASASKSAAKAGSKQDSKAASESDAEKGEKASAPSSKTSDAKPDANQPMAPAVRRLLADYNLDPASITGSGKDDRLTKADVLKAIENGSARTLGSQSASGGQASSAKASAETAPEAPREERVPMTRMRKRIAERLKDAQNTAAMLTTFNDVDMSAVMASRNQYKDLFEKKHGIKLGFMSFFVHAAVLALREVPGVNARIDGDEIVYQNFYNIGVAVSAPTGLVVPVVRNADQLSFADTEKAIVEYGRKARDGKLAVNDLTGGTFTISNGGIFGSLLSTPILNAPQSAILGMHRIEERPVAIKGQVVIRPMMYLALSYDHRLIDGREAVTFLVRMKDAIEDPSRLLLDL
ncbi:dihydrolipoyllysine-residue succinyltransferase component of 2-oxoglutarate dehydrogenase complex [Iodidimonas nitroreducens]|uniref:Dihydrolipoyllysine-residue succinyltransferase component of 2-oxoglutarate dehydrogenase complex n=1 Tax=Iodidimonas nitroreducens TaxID=1236968 RepID=A0A5A7N8Q3_9PROT|nr:2-oxoglutarate dehydrogenase complex dihydrolipoyllysine-residue succinyltransferase [Iodidimonas nitroreducens]GAK34266.1 dihydrolipoyllysine-residue succinyltransferase component of 2-oxoglutarate dehydrogenase complex [alpha proteobacterium Q-1]GER04721.1 dihydrolipoyllysine-residue succinyltransferase component of 2-oxoglutarate dehydrogenase complex [Iodidimonas nitroreducens]